MFRVRLVALGDQDGKLLLTGDERAEQEKQRADRLSARLRELGIDPEELS
jgi:hypothetical protein